MTIYDMVLLVFPLYKQYKFVISLTSYCSERKDTSKPNFSKQKQNRKQKWPFTYRLQNWKPELLYSIILIIDQIKTLLCNKLQLLSECMLNR